MCKDERDKTFEYRNISSVGVLKIDTVDTLIGVNLIALIENTTVSNFSLLEIWTLPKPPKIHPYSDIFNFKIKIYIFDLENVKNIHVLFF